MMRSSKPTVCWSDPRTDDELRISWIKGRSVNGARAVIAMSGRTVISENDACRAFNLLSYKISTLSTSPTFWALVSGFILECSNQE